MTKKSIARISLISCLLLVASIVAFQLIVRPNPPPAAPVQQNVQALPATPTVSEARLPPHILAELTRLCGNCRIADSNADWQSTDVVIGDSDLPVRRFTSINQTDNGWEIQYERGGFVKSHLKLLLSNDPSPQVLPGSSCVPASDTKCRWQ